MRLSLPLPTELIRRYWCDSKHYGLPKFAHPMLLRDATGSFRFRRLVGYVAGTSLLDECAGVDSTACQP